jgi:chaperone required for assembly of F1-ATPase
MSKDASGLGADFFVAPTERDPVKAARDPARALPKRFYKQASVTCAADGFEILLDGRPVNTPAKRRLAAPSVDLAQALAAEWAAQGEMIDPSTMPLNRLANTAIDGVAGKMAVVEEELLKYAASDLICYRAEGPDALVQAQAEAWDPIIAFVRERLGARLTLAEGVMFVAQPDSARAALAAAVRDRVGTGAGAPFRLAALYDMTTLTGSLALALALALGAISLDAAWAAVHVDEDCQMRVWGSDTEALARRARRFSEMRAAAVMAELAAASAGDAGKNG